MTTNSHLIEECLRKGIAHIKSETWPDGMMKLYGFDREANEPEYDDLTTFFTGLSGLMLQEIDHPDLTELKKKMVQLLEREVLNAKFWMWSALNSHLRKIIPPDIDSSSVNSEFLLHNGILLDNLGALSRNRPKDPLKGFYTWIVLRPQLFNEHWKDILTIIRHGFYRAKVWETTSSTPNELNAFVSLNAYCYFIQKDSSFIADAENFISQFLTVEEMHCVYYPNTYTRYFLMSRVLAFSKNKGLRERFLPALVNPEKLTDMELSCFILTYRNLDKKLDALYINALAARQQPDGSFNKDEFFCHMDSMIWRSPGFNTALALNALVGKVKSTDFN